jgi:hypothetical protein
MDVEVTVEASKTRPVLWPYRLVEALGLMAVLYGLASDAWWIAILGAVTIAVIYAVFRKRHGRQGGQGSDGGGGFPDNDGDGGGD